MCKMLAHVNVLGTLASTDDVATPLNSCSVIFKYGCWSSLSKTLAAQQRAEVNDLLGDVRY